ncbi:hypothetical protein [Streptomyces clavifer]|uniref:hypothetical protein n=1 Tax=Streptomyces clavifer TaxID=68188 RepID=UPI0036829E3C
MTVEISGIVRSTATNNAEPTGYAPGPQVGALLGTPGYSRIDIRTDTASLAAGSASAELTQRIRQAVPGAQV